MPTSALLMIRSKGQPSIARSDLRISAGKKSWAGRNPDTTQAMWLVQDPTLILHSGARPPFALNRSVMQRFFELG